MEYQAGLATEWEMEILIEPAFSGPTTTSLREVQEAGDDQYILLLPFFAVQS